MYRCESFSAAFSTIALREFTLATSFKKMAEYLPKQSRYTLLRGFIEGHVELDQDEHSVLISKALEMSDNVERSIIIMKKFYELRSKLYDAANSLELVF